MQRLMPKEGIKMNYDSFMKNKVVVPFEAMPKLRVEMEHVKHELVTYLQG